MAVIKSNDYDHIDIVNGSSTNRHMLKDTEARAGIGSLCSSVSTVKHAIGQNGQLTLNDALNEPAKKMTIKLEPKQDLHGYDKPWVEGSGKNLLPILASSTTIAGVQITVNKDNAENNISVTFSGTATSDVYFYVTGTTSGIPSSMLGKNIVLSGGKDGVILRAWHYDGTNIARSLNGSDSIAFVCNQGVIDCYITSGTTVNTTIYPMARLSTVADSTYEPYSNICPIEGYDTVEITGVTNNIYNKSDVILGRNWCNQGSANRAIFVAKTEKGKTLHIKAKQRGNTHRVVIVGTDVLGTNAIQSFNKNFQPGLTTTEYDVTADEYVIAQFEKYNDATNSAVLQEDVDCWDIALSYTEIKTVSVNLVSSAGSTVYGGTVTVNEDGSGTLVVDRAKISFAGKAWAAKGTYANTYGIIVTNDNPRHAVNDNLLKESLSNKYVWYSSATVGNMDYGFGMPINNDLQFYVKDKDIATVEEANSKLSDLEISYPLHYPVSYNITATQLQTLVGENHIWTDGTNIELDYHAEKYADLDKLFAALPKDTVIGNPASFTDGADGLPLDKLTVAIEPKQDLHGYDKPWVGGAGKNLFKNTFTSGVVNNVQITVNDDGSMVLNNTSSTYAYLTLGTINFKAGQSYTISKTNITDSSCYFRLLQADYGVWNNDRTYTSNEDSTQTLQFVFPANFAFSNTIIYPMIRLASVSDPTFEPYSNVCPIEAWDEVEVKRSGKNLLADNGYVQGVLDWNSSNADVITNNIHFISSPYIRISANTQYAISSFAGNIVRIYVTDENHNKLYFLGNYPTAGTTRIIPATAGAHYIRISIGIDDQTVTPSDYGTKVYGQLEAGSTATAYEAYNGQTLPVSMKSVAGSSVYGGTLTVNRDGTGTMVVNKAYKKLVADDMVSLTDSGMTTQMCCVTAEGVPANSATTFNPICSHYKTVAWGQSPWNSDKCISSYVWNQIRIKDSSLATLADYKNFVTNNNVQVCYQLNTPVTYTLTANQLTTLLGTNNVSCDAGEMTVNYNADITMFVINNIVQALNSL